MGGWFVVVVVGVRRRGGDGVFVVRRGGDGGDGVVVIGCIGAGATVGDEIGEGAGGCYAGHAHSAGRAVPAGESGLR